MGLFFFPPKNFVLSFVVPLFFFFFPASPEIRSSSTLETILYSSPSPFTPYRPPLPSVKRSNITPSTCLIRDETLQRVQPNTLHAFYIIYCTIHRTIVRGIFRISCYRVRVCVLR